MAFKPLENQLPSGIQNESNTYILGVDFARLGGDETALVILEQPYNSNDVFIAYIETMTKKHLNEVIGRVLYLHSIIGFKKVYCDVTGLGAGPVDVLAEKMGGIIEGITFTQSTKADMFYNLKLLMQQNKLKIPDYRNKTETNIKKLFYQFLAITQTFGTSSELPKFSHEKGSHDDLICSLALACLHFRVGRKRRKSYGLTGVHQY